MARGTPEFLAQLAQDAGSGALQGLPGMNPAQWQSGGQPDPRVGGRSKQGIAEAEKRHFDSLPSNIQQLMQKQNKTQADWNKIRGATKRQEKTRSASELGINRARKDPKKAFGALSKLTKNMNPQQLQQLQHGMGNIFGQNFGGLGAGDQAAEAFDNLSDVKTMQEGSQSQKEIAGGNIQALLAQMGLTGPGGPGGPGINPPPQQPQPPVGINPPPPPGGPGIGNLQGTMGAMGGAGGMRTTEWHQQQEDALRNSPQWPQIEAQRLARQQGVMGMGGQQGNLQGVMGAMGGAGGANGTTVDFSNGMPMITPGNLQGTMGAMGAQGGAQQAGAAPAPAASSANTSPTISPTDHVWNPNPQPPPPPTPPPGSPPTAGAQIGTGPLTPGVTTGQLQNAVTGSAALNNPVNNAQQMFQGTYGGLINMPGQADIANQMSVPGQSMLQTPHGTGSLANIAQQQMANQATTQGLGQRQQMIGQNLQQQMGAGQLASGMDLGQRQQFIGHLGTMLGPALAGTAGGFQAGLGGLTQNVQS